MLPILSSFVLWWCYRKLRAGEEQPNTRTGSCFPPTSPPSLPTSSQHEATLDTSRDADLEGQDDQCERPWFNLRPRDDDLPQKWWFASTAIPLIAATIAPFANVLCLVGIITRWKLALPDNGQLPEGTDNNGLGIKDPSWQVKTGEEIRYSKVIALNVCSLAFGVVGNMSLLFNFTGSVRYLISLPVSIISGLLASGMLVASTTAMHLHLPPVSPGEIYSQGFWHTIFAGSLYLIGAVLLLINLAGYLLGHYPQRFALDHDQRILIIQTMVFFAWMAGGSGIISHLEDWTYANSIYWAAESFITAGFGDFAPVTNRGRAFFMVYMIIGVIPLGLIIGSITRFMENISKDKIMKGREHELLRNTMGKSVRSKEELMDRLGLQRRRSSDAGVEIDSLRDSISAYGTLEMEGRNMVFNQGAHDSFPSSPRTQWRRAQGACRNKKLLLLHREDDRFDRMRKIQADSRERKSWVSFLTSLGAVSVLWFGGAAVFMFAEQHLQQTSFFDAWYFAFVCLMTIGYGDIYPRSELGKAFFIIWCMVAVPTMTVLVQKMGNTVVDKINKGSSTVADWTILPRQGVWTTFLRKSPTIRRISTLERPRSLSAVFGPPKTTNDTATGAPMMAGSDGSSTTTTASGDNPGTTIQQLAGQAVGSESALPHDLARELTKALKRVGQDLASGKGKEYSFAEWRHFTKLIRFTLYPDDTAAGLEEEGEENAPIGPTDWDWLDESSPMMSKIGEAAWAHEMLCESMARHTRHVARVARAEEKRRQEQEQQLMPVQSECAVLDPIETVSDESYLGEVDGDVYYPDPLALAATLKFESQVPPTERGGRRRAVTFAGILGGTQPRESSPAAGPSTSTDPLANPSPSTTSNASSSASSSPDAGGPDAWGPSTDCPSTEERKTRKKKKRERKKGQQKKKRKRSGG